MVGVCTQTEGLIGRPDLGGADRWYGLLSNRSRTGLEFSGAWNRLKSLGEGLCLYLDIPLEGPLSTPITNAGNGSTDGTTRSLVTKSIEGLHLQAIIKLLSFS